MSTHITRLTDPWHYYTYRYDQLNRIKASRSYKAGTTATLVTDYHETFTYDGNGNVNNVSRYAGAATIMDSLTYNYNTTGGRLINNRLNYITDAVATHTWPYGLDNQAVNNYTYDAIGNMTADVRDTLSAINWNVYNKIQSLTNSKGTITYTYNPAGQRVSKTLNGLTTWYIRDAQGNTLALYDNKNSNVNLREQDLYGSSRLGMWQPNVNLVTNNALAVWDTVGNKEYELNNHLGNVLTTITDKRVQHTTNGTTIDYYNSDIATAQEYYAFGGLMPGRTYIYAANNYYRYGFNGKENDNEVQGLGNQQDYGARIYDPRVIRFLSVDPISKSYPWWTPYEFAALDPVRSVDIDGRQVEDEDPEMEFYDPVREQLKNLDFEKEKLPEDEPSKLPKKPTPPRPKLGERLLSLPGKFGRSVSKYLDDLPENVANAFPDNETTRFKEAAERFNQNRANGQALEKVLTNVLLKNFSNKEVANQVTLQIAGKVNGQDVSVRIRVDNLTNKNGTINLYEAKFSLERITEGNFARTLTQNQRQAFSIITSGTNVSIFVRGNNGATAELGTGFEIDLNNANFNIVTNSGQNGQIQTVKSVPLKPN